MNTPAARAAARDRWADGSRATRAARALDYTAATLITLGIFLAGSLNF